MDETETEEVARSRGRKQKIKETTATGNIWYHRWVSRWESLRVRGFE